MGYEVSWGWVLVFWLALAAAFVAGMAFATWVRSNDDDDDFPPDVGCAA